MSESPTRIVTVEIHGLRYPIRSALDPAYVSQLAAYVDAKMQVAADEAPTSESLRIAVLAALNIADEHFRLRDREPDPAVEAALLDDLRQRAATLEGLVDAALAAARDA